MLRKLSFLMVLICMCSATTSCYDAREIDDEVYALAIGIDKGTTNKLRLTVGYPNYKGGGGGDSSKENKSESAKEGFNISVVECPTIMEGINMFGMFVSRRISLMHIKDIVISEDVARDGVDYIFAPLARYNETRSTMNVIISRGSAEEFIKKSDANIGMSRSKAGELLIQQSFFSNYFPTERFLEFYTAMYSGYRQPVAIYGGLNEIELVPANSKESPLITGKGDLPGEIAREAAGKVELAGMAVFRKDRMVGFLDTYEFAYYQMIIGKLTSKNITIEDKNAQDKAIVINIKNSRKPIIKTFFEDGKPALNVKVALEGDIQAIQSGINYESIDRIEELNKQIEDFLLEGITRTVEKTQKELKSDVFGFGRQFAGHFFTIKEWEKYDWLNHYPEAKVNIEVDVNVRRTGVLIGTTKINTEKSE